MEKQVIEITLSEKYLQDGEYFGRGNTKDGKNPFTFSGNKDHMNIRFDGYSKPTVTENEISPLLKNLIGL